MLGISHDLRHADLLLRLIRGVLQKRLLGQALPGLIIAHGCIDRHRIRSGLDASDIESGNLFDMPEDGIELRSKGMHLFVRKLQTSERGNAANIHVGLRHARTLMKAWGKRHRFHGHG